MLSFNNILHEINLFLYVENLSIKFKKMSTLHFLCNINIIHFNQELPNNTRFFLMNANRLLSHLSLNNAFRVKYIVFIC